MKTLTFTMSEAQANLIHNLADNHQKAIKNWIAGRVESGDLEGAQKLVLELRQVQAVFAAFNMDAKREIAEATKTPVGTEFSVQDRVRG